MKRSRPACLSPSAELFPIAIGVQVQALSQFIEEALASTDPVDPEILENEKLWQAGKKDEWFRAEIRRALKK